jgi:hypothetical protein
MTESHQECQEWIRERTPFGDVAEEMASVTWQELPPEGRDESMDPRLPAGSGGHVWSSLSGRSCVNIRLSFLLRFTYSKLFSVFANTFYSECRINTSSSYVKLFSAKGWGFVPFQPSF